jgi:hypothetical protein
VGEPDHGELEQATVSHLTKHAIGNLRVQAKPFQRATWPPDSTEFVGELFLMVHSTADRPSDRLREALAHLRQGVESGEIALGGFSITEFSEDEIFHEADDEQGKIRVLPIVVKVEQE